MESIIQSEDFFTQSIDIIEVRISRLENMHRNEETLLTQSLTVLDTSSHINGNQESWYLEDYDQNSISPQNFELDQYQTIDKLASFYFNEIDLEQKCEFKLSFRDSISKFQSMLCSVSLPKLYYIPKPTWIFVPTNLEIEPLIFYNHIPLMGKECES